MHGKLCPKIILEGTRLTFKTEIAFELNAHPELVGPRRYRYHSPLISGEWCAFTPFPWGRGLINYAPEEEPLAIETYRTWMHLLELQKFYSWIIDRWHLSTQMHQFLERGVRLDFDWMEERLERIGFVLVFLHRSPESFAAARAERLKVSGNPSQYDQLDRFVREQQVMEDLVARTRLPVIRHDISDNDLDRAIDAIVRGMKASGRILPYYA